MKFCSFDIETATLTPDGDDPHKYRPLGIACAATQLVDTDLGQLGIHRPIPWASWSDGAPDPDVEMYGLRMTPGQLGGLVDYLVGVAHNGFMPLTWNGLGFDFDILAEEVFDKQIGREVARLAMSQYDIAFQMLCDKGYMIGMQAAAKGMGLAGKSEGMHGDLAPVLWAKSRADQDHVLDYVERDVQTTSELAIAISERHQLSWISKTGRPHTWQVGRLLNVIDSLARPLPDTSWMTSPRTRESCHSWTAKYV